MRWESWSQFWAMGGYAVYVWGSVGVTALLLAVEVWQARWAHRDVLNQLKAEQALAQLPNEDVM
ncbi:MAG: heme exporter protein CcmD [Burkholderiales bacterium 35-55-47]|jgi:heme exporter protein D|uniref:heme exporter protein CcmD n=1 Tax=Limnohabitans sp. TaxID=1907725 RepID=UPI000BD82DF3|nr:heme exporter protein CcmD [Limnohabitans sp.]OYY20226.1 MAG: heme exporter protein CcmD [Burkholderiales bacterium 35-55-47]OYZ74162.1 MAG: heme exporter protein CcmD [Burkholderiales bacterium 24-55-52]OZB01946.1 MAG: heme exporter protein CcmD [Burkholderiales bacterium 39-55-53]HQR86474.1 heme exporter protein CcmD [Limnohabitans sp.]HQS25609.1 heme exporter protein CcmD [Limnohabitans sp.]